MLSRLLLSLLLLCLSPVTVMAQTSTALFEQPATAKQLAQLKQQLQIMLPIRGHFSQQRYLKVLSQPLTSQGQFIVAEPQGMVWQQVKPFANTLVLTPKALYSQDSQQQWQQTSIDQAGVASQIAQLLPNVIKALLTGDLAAMQQSFTLYLQPLPDQNWQLGLTPKDPLLAKAFKQLILQGKHSLEQLTIISAEQDKTVIQFSQLKSGPLSAQESALFSPLTSTNAN